MKKTILRRDKSRWCALEVALNDGRLSVCGLEGIVVSEAEAHKEALDYWTSFFEDNPSERRAMNKRFNRNFRTARSAARFVISTSGEFYGLDVYRHEKGEVFITYSCGQIRDELDKWFPEHIKYFKWHLNDMHAECEHQEARGETYSNHPGIVCADCGYKLGSAWTKRELPADVIKWVEGL